MGKISCGMNKLIGHLQYLDRWPSPKYPTIIQPHTIHLTWPEGDTVLHISVINVSHILVVTSKQKVNAIVRYSLRCHVMPNRNEEYTDCGESPSWYFSSNCFYFMVIWQIKVPSGLVEIWTIIQDSVTNCISCFSHKDAFLSHLATCI